MIRRWCAPGLAAVVAVLVAGGHADGQTDSSLNRAGSGARAAGMGDAFVAVSDDGTAASWNPAGLAQLRQPEFSLGYVASNRGLHYTGLRSPDERVAFSNQNFDLTTASIDFTSAALPFSLAGRPVTLQLGWQRLYQLTSDLSGNVMRVPIDPPGPPTRVSRDDRLSGAIDLFSVAGAVKLFPRLAVGGSLNIWRGDWHDRVALSEERSAEGSPAFLTSSAAVRMRGRNVTVGALLTFPRWNLGLAYHSPFWSAYRLQGRSQSTLGPDQVVDAQHARFHLPRSVAAGLARRLGPRWTASVALTHDQWTDTLIDGFPGQQAPNNFFDSLPPELSSTRDTLSLNLGLEHLVLREGAVVPLRFGFGFEPQGGMDASTRDPVTFLLVSAGAGYNTNRLKFDGAVQYRWDAIRVSDTLTVDRARNGGPPDALGRAASHEWRVKVSLIYRIADTEKPRAARSRILGPRGPG